MDNSVSDEMLNAYLDNELDEKDTRFIDTQIKNIPELQYKIEQLQDIKLKIRASYAGVEPPFNPQIHSASNTHLIPAGIAASVIMVIGLAAGWYSHSYLNNHPASTDHLLGVKLEALKPKDNKIMIHLAQNDIALFDQALTKAETILAGFEAFNPQGKVHILANSYGMDLLRADTSPFQKRIINLMQSYDNVNFVACKNTLKRLQSSGKNTDLLPGVKVNGPVINEIVSSLQNGWTYIKI